MNLNPCRFLKPARVIKFLVPMILFLFFFRSLANAQNEWLFNNYPNNFVRVFDETYDGGILVQVFADTANAPVHLFKYSLEGKILYEKILKNVSPISSIINTDDSGYVLISQVFTHPVNNSTLDTSGNIALLKFDKCAKLQWARYVKSTHEGAVPIDIVADKDAYYLCAIGINGINDHLRKLITLIKFSKSGFIRRNISYEGNEAKLYISPDSNSLYLTQNLDIAINKDTSILYPFSGLRVIDTSLNTINQLLIGYNQESNKMGPLSFNGNELKQSSLVYMNNGNRSVLFSGWNKNLIQEGNFKYDSTERYGFTVPQYSVSHNDTLFVCNLVQNNAMYVSNDTTFTSLRMYDNNYNLIKEAIISKNWLQEPVSFLSLKNGSFIIANVNYNRNTGKIDNSSLYLFDRKLNNLAWPTIPPAKGYDWACSSIIPDTQTINVASVVTPVYITPDYSQPDWKKLTNSPPPYTISNYCSNIPVVFTPFTYLSSPYFHWDFGDSASGKDDTSSQRIGVHLYKTPGQYTAHLYSYDYMGLQDTFTSIITISKGLTAEKEDTVLCSGETITIDAANPSAQHLWNNGDTIRSKIVGPGIYWVMVTNGTCTIIDTFHIADPNGFKINTGHDTTVAKGKSLILSTGYPSTLWSTGVVGESIQVQSGKFWAQLKGDKCETTDTIRILTVTSMDSNLCAGETATLDAGNPGAKHLWNNGDTSQSITIGPGTYWVKVSFGTFSITDSFHITGISKTKINLGNDVSVTEGTILTLHSGYPTTIWSTGAVGDSIRVALKNIYVSSEKDTFWAALKGDHCEVIDTIHVTFYIPVPIKINMDTNLCTGETVTLDAGNPSSSSIFPTKYRWDDGSTGRTRTVGPGKYSVIISNISGIVLDSVYVYAMNSTKINLGKDTTIVSGTTLVLHSGYKTAIWSTGEKGESIKVIKAGTYWASLKGDKCEVSDTIVVKTRILINMSAITNLNICDGETVTLNAGHPGTTHLWNDGDTSTYRTVGSGTYWVSMNFHPGIVTDTAHIYGVHGAKINLGNDTTLVNGTILTLHSGYPTTIWSTGVSGEFININKAGTYWAALKGDNCEMSDTINISFKSGIEAGIKNSTPNLNLYPNPAQNVLNFSFYSENEEAYNIVIIDIRGKLVLEHKFNSIKGTNANIIDIDNLSPGNYLFRLSSGSNSATKSFEIERK